MIPFKMRHLEKTDYHVMEFKGLMKVFDIDSLFSFIILKSDKLITWETRVRIGTRKQLPLAIVLYPPF